MLTPSGPIATEYENSCLKYMIFGGNDECIHESVHSKPHVNVK